LTVLAGIRHRTAGSRTASRNPTILVVEIWADWIPAKLVGLWSSDSDDSDSTLSNFGIG